MDERAATAKAGSYGAATHIHLIQVAQRRIDIRHCDELPNITCDDLRALRKMDLAKDDEGSESAQSRGKTGRFLRMIDLQGREK